MIRYSSFNYVALLHSLMANVSAHRSREWGTIAAVVRRRPPWFIVFIDQCMFLCWFVWQHFHVAKLGMSQFLPRYNSLLTKFRFFLRATWAGLCLGVLNPDIQIWRVGIWPQSLYLTSFCPVEYPIGMLGVVSQSCCGYLLLPLPHKCRQQPLKK